MKGQNLGLPDELGIWEDITRGEQRIKVRSEKRRFGKFVTVISGFDNVDIQKITKELKRKLACGGTAKDSVIELQGNHKTRVKDILKSLGFSTDMIEVI